MAHSTEPSDPDNTPYEQAWGNTPPPPKLGSRVKGAFNMFNAAALAAAGRGDFANALAASTPGGIEAQEAAGQSDMIASSQIPKEIRGATRKELEALGFSFKVDEEDPLFYKASLPEGWSIRPTKHSMHSDVIDSNGAARAHIFYKAAFYDRRADMRMVHRYARVSDYLDGLRQVYIKDEKTGDKLFQSGICAEDDYVGGDAQDKEAKAWLDKNFPDHKDAMAYWD